MPQLEFTLSTEVARLGVRGACLVMEGIANKPHDDRFEKHPAHVLAELAVQYDEQTLLTDPVLAGFRALHEKVGRSNRRFPPSSQRLVEMLIKQATMPAINLAVDIYNLVSLQTRLSIGAHDVAQICGNITLRLTNGAERFVPLGRDKAEAIPAREYAYVDDSGQVLCRLDCRQADATKVTASTRTCFYMVQGHEGTSRACIEDAVERLVDMTKTYCGGTERLVWSG